MSKFYPFQPVLVRCLPTEIWNTAFFDSEWNVSSTEIVYRMVGGGCYSQCIPYEGNEKYIHTTDTPEPEWKPTPGELIEVSDNLGKDFWPKFIFKGMSGNKYICGSGDFTTEWRYARKPQAVIKEPEDTPPIPNKGDLVAVRDYAGDAWTIRVFSHMEGNRYVCFRWYAIRNSYCNNNTSDWEECVPLCLCKAITSKLVGDKQ